MLTLTLTRRVTCPMSGHTTSWRRRSGREEKRCCSMRSCGDVSVKKRSFFVSYILYDKTQQVQRNLVLNPTTFNNPQKGIFPTPPTDGVSGSVGGRSHREPEVWCHKPAPDQIHSLFVQNWLRVTTSLPDTENPGFHQHAVSGGAESHPDSQSAIRNIRPAHSVSLLTSLDNRLMTSLIKCNSQV